MTGQPIFQKLKRDIEETGGEDWFFDQVADGRMMKDIASQFGISRSLIYRWLKVVVNDYESKLRAARLLASHVHVEDALEIIDNADVESQAGVSKAKEQANFRKWLASVRNRKDFGEQKGPVIALNISSLHLDALKASGITAAALQAPAADKALPPGVSTVEEGDFEIVADE